MQAFDGKKLAALRKAAGYTQKAFGAAIGTSEQQYQRWEYGKVDPTATYLLRMQVLLNCTPQDLLTDE